MRIETPRSLRLEHDDLAHVLAAAEELLVAARGANRLDLIDFAERLMNHVRLEEEVLYPAAVLVGEYLRLRLDADQRIVI